jgi:hypothetical protein
MCLPLRWSSRKLRNWALWERVVANTLSRLWETTILENGVAQACSDLDIPIVAYR